MYYVRVAEQGVASFDSFPQHGVGSSDFSTSFTSVLLYQARQATPLHGPL